MLGQRICKNEEETWSGWKCLSAKRGFNKFLEFDRAIEFLKRTEASDVPVTIGSARLCSRPARGDDGDRKAALRESKSRSQDILPLGGGLDNIQNKAEVYYVSWLAWLIRCVVWIPPGGRNTGRLKPFDIRSESAPVVEYRRLFIDLAIPDQ